MYILGVNHSQFPMARKTKAEAEHTRQSLLDAAELVFHERGVSRTSLADIAYAAGLTRGAIYWHFKDKADLFNAMVERVTGPMEKALDVALQATDESSTGPVNRMMVSLKTVLQQTVFDQQIRRVLEISAHKAEYVEELRPVVERRLQVMRRFRMLAAKAIHAEITQKAINMPISVDEAAMGIQLLIDGIISNWLIAPEAFDLEAVGARALATYLRGLGFTDFDVPAPHP